MIAPHPDSLTVHVCAYGLAPVEIWDVPVALLDPTTKEDGRALLEEWVKTTSINDDGPMDSVSTGSAVAVVHMAWAGTLNADRYVYPKAKVDEWATAAAEFRANWDQWVGARRNPTTTA